jgi:hypothetical protein
MSVKNKTAGYSEALGGYGVPAQVKVTGDADGAKAETFRKPRKSQGLVFRPKPKNIIAIIVIIAAVVVAIFFATGQLGTSKYASSIEGYENTPSSMNGADATVYQPIVAESVDWNNVSDDERSGIAQYAVNKILGDMSDPNSGIYSIVGYTHERQPAFLYAQGDSKIQIYKDGEVVTVIPYETPQ